MIFEIKQMTLLRKAQDLLRQLGVRFWTMRHETVVMEFLLSKERDAKAMLTELGNWDENDLEIAEEFSRNNPL